MYKLGKVIGSGSDGSVSIALHKMTRQFVAIKSIDLKKIQEDRRRMFKLRREIDVLRTLRHKTSHVTKIYETFKTEEHFNIVMELCRGGDLFDFFKQRGKLPEKEAKIIFKQVMLGIQSIH